MKTAEEKTMCTLSDTELIKKCKEWISKLAQSGGSEWSLRVPVDFNHDPDVLFSELCNRLEKIPSPESNVIIETIRFLKEEILECDPNDGYCGKCDSVRNHISELEKLLNK